MPDDNYQNLGPRTFWIFIIARSGIFWAFLLLTIIFLGAKIFFTESDFISQNKNILNISILIGLAAVFISGAIIVLISWLEYSRFKYFLDTDSFKIIRGVLTKHEIAIPYRRIQAVDIKQPLLYQLFGVSRITIETIIDTQPQSDNKTDDNDEVLPAIDDNLAHLIQEELTKRANVQKMNLPQ